MSWYCKEADARQYANDLGRVSATRVFHVWTDDEDLSEPLLVIDRFGQTATNGERLPYFGDPFVSAGDLRAVSPSIDPVDNAYQTWKVTWRYITGTFAALQPNSVGFVEFTATGTAEFRDKWRIGAVVPVNNGVAGSGVSEWTDIGGGYLDIAGEPLSGLHITQEINISITLAGASDINWNSLRQSRGRRNSTAFGGIPAGYLYFKNYTVSRAVQSQYRIGLVFIEDQDAHLVQVPFRGPNGEIVTQTDLSTPSVNGSLVTRAATVGWKQPFNSTTDFYNLSPYLAGQI